MMARALQSVLWNMAVSVVMVAGFVAGVEGARNLALFYLWVVYLPVSILALSDPMCQALSKSPPLPFAVRAFGRFVVWQTLVVLITKGFHK